MTIHAFKSSGTVQNATPDTTTTGGWTGTELWANAADTNYQTGRPNSGVFNAAWPYDGPSWRSNYPFRVDLSELPAGKTIVSATLYLRLSSADGAGNHDIAARRLLVPFVQAEATWNNRADSTAWNTGGGLGTGSDVASGNVASTAVGNTVDTWHSWNVTDYVAGVYAETFSNHGLLLIRDIGSSPGDGSNRRFIKENNDTANLRPELIVVYEDAATGPALTAGDPAVTSITQTGATVNYSTDTAGTAYIVKTTSATEPSAAQIKAGQNHTGAAAVYAANASVASGARSFTTSGGSASTLYYWYIILNDGTDDSNVLSGSFTTSAAVGATHPFTSVNIGG